MHRSRRWSALVSLVVMGLVTTPLSAQGPPAEKWLIDRSMNVSPAPEPARSLKYRLLPLASERVSGNAVPIYLRLVHEQGDAARRMWTETPAKWNDLPLSDVPMSEAKSFLATMRNFLRQLELGARRTTAEWNYTLDQGSPVEILLPDVQAMRNYIPMTVLKARVEMAENNFDAAARTLQTGLAFGRHVAEGPFLINGLVGIAVAHHMVDRIPEFQERPGSPNLYWSLTNLPRPLIDLRHAFEFEERVVELQFPDLATLDQPRSPEQWAAALKRVRAEMDRLSELDKERSPAAAGAGANDPGERSPDLNAARKHLVETAKRPAADVAAMPPAQVLLLYLADGFKGFQDDRFKAAALPYTQARPVLAVAEQRLAAAPETEAKRLARILMPAIDKVLTAQNRLERRIAALRVIEAVRLHAAANGGVLPDRLADIVVVPVPTDPGTDKPFEYRREGRTATIVGRVPELPPETSAIRYRVTVR